MFSNASRLGSEAKYGSRAKGSEDDPDEPELVPMDDDDDVAMEAPMDVDMDDEPPVDVDMVDDDPEDVLMVDDDPEDPVDVLIVDDEPPVVVMVDDDPESVLQGIPPQALMTVPRMAAQSGSARHCASSTAHVVGSKHTR